MSDTPRMDSVAELASGIVDAAILAEGMNLERELNAATSEIERLTAKVAQLYEGAEEQKQRIKRLEGELESTKADRDSWSNQSDEFAKTAADLIIHIKRLEEAGDKMADLLDGGVFMKLAVQWRKAKEAKP